MTGIVFLRRGIKRKREQGEVELEERKIGEKGIVCKIGRVLEEGITIFRIIRGKKKKDLIIVSIYNLGDWEMIEMVLRKIVEERERVISLI